MGKNLHKLYYRDYFKEVDFQNKDTDQNLSRICFRSEPGVEVDFQNKDTDQNSTKVKRINQQLTAGGLLQPIRNGMASHTFSCKVVYPGLVTGIGIDHEVGVKEEFKLGVHFDWTHGMPVVYGSSVKGVVKSYFEDFYTTQYGGKKEDCQPLMQDIFGSYKKDIANKKSIYDRDIFFDAVITKADSQGRILCPDSITPHPDPLRNPIPITFLKIAPGCTIEFRFKLVDSTITRKDGSTLTFTAEEKRKLFREILTTVGIGAKTNVGYGQLNSI